MAFVKGFVEVLFEVDSQNIAEALEYNLGIVLSVTLNKKNCLFYMGKLITFVDHKITTN